jgi:hypothetical protein
MKLPVFKSLATANCMFKVAQESKSLGLIVATLTTSDLKKTSEQMSDIITVAVNGHLMSELRLSPSHINLIKWQEMH